MFHSEPLRVGMGWSWDPQETKIQIHLDCHVLYDQQRSELKNSIVHSSYRYLLGNCLVQLLAGHREKGDEGPKEVLGQRA